MHHEKPRPVADPDDQTWQPTGDDGIPVAKTDAPAYTDAPTSAGGLTPIPGGDAEPTTAPGRPREPDSGDSDGQSADGSEGWDASPPPKLAPGEVIFGKFKLLSMLGEGGMGQVWLVKNLEMDKKRALKLISPRIARNDRGWRRFKREAQLMAKLEHPNAVSVYTFGRSQSIGFIEMAYVRGKSLARVVEELGGRPMPLKDIVPLVEQLCSVLQRAHAHTDEDTGKLKSIVHRDLKPSNLMVVEGEPAGSNLRVLDFGIAKMVDDDHSQETQLTRDGEYLGTVFYSSPEQIREGVRNQKTGKVQEIDARSDLYSAGVILYQLLTGVLPFRSPNPNAVLACHLAEPPPPMAEANPRAVVPAEVERVVMKCLEKDPSRRPKDARELAEAFHKAAEPHLTGGRGDRNPVRPAAAVVAALALALVVALAARKPWSGGAVNAKTAPGAPAVPVPIANGTGKAGDKAKALTTPVGVPLWEPEGYKAVDQRNPAPGSRNEPRRLRREADGAEFDRYKDGIYLPAGYVPEDPADSDGDWPRAIIRAEDEGKDADDRTRFLRIKGKTFLFGDPRPGPLEGCEPLYVAVRDVYLQETEVTNGEVEAYLAVHHEVEKDLKDWREYANLLAEADPRNAPRYPAVAVNYVVARAYARFRGGRLPTEAEWELAGKSGVDDDLWSWGKRPPTGGKPLAHLLGVRVGPVAAKAFPGDRTGQGVFGMTGNVREWCLNPAGPDARAVPNGNGPENPLADDPWDPSRSDPAKVDRGREYAVRGGSFLKPLDQAMVFLRDKEAAGEARDDLGFRVAIECPPTPAGP